MKINALIHAPFELPGVITSWSNQNGFELSETHTYRNDVFPTVDQFDFLIVMGGPQSPLEVERYPYLHNEITLIKQAINADKHVLGFCLGAQLIAESLGAKTERSPEKEVGVYPLTLTQAGKSDRLLEQFPETFNVVHWHNDMPGLPAGSVALAESAGCPRQVVRFNNKTYGFQCHLEPTLENIKDMIANCPNDLAPSKFTQTKQKLLVQNYDEINQKMIQFLDSFIKN